MRERENFSLVDSAWLHMDEPTSMAMIVGVIMFEKPLAFAALQQLVRKRLLRVPRFRQRVREPSWGVGVPQWERDPHFDLAAHLHRIALPAPHDQSALHELVGDLMSTPLDFSKPLWQMHLVEEYDKGCALIARIHHAMGDGLALVQVLLSLADDVPAISEAESREESDASQRSWLEKRGGMIKQAVKFARFGTKFASELAAIATDPNKLRDRALFGAAGSVALGKLLLIGPDQPSLFKGNVGVMKRAAWSKPLPLDEVKFAAKGLGGTINDVLISAVAGALRRYLDARGEDTRGLNLRAMIPVNLRSPSDLDLEDLGNQFGLVFLDLPVGVVEPLERMAVLKERMDYIKSSPEALVAFGILGAIGATPVALERIINRLFGMKATAVMTNVPGPREPIYLIGNRIRGIMFWVPTPASLGLGVSIISYAGQVIVGVGTDAGLVPNPNEIVNDFVEEFEAFRKLAKQRISVKRKSGAKRRERATLGRGGRAARRARVRTGTGSGE